MTSVRDKIIQAICAPRGSMEMQADHILAMVAADAMTLKNEAENAAAMLRCIRDSGNIHQICGIPIADIKDMVSRLEAATGTKGGIDVETTGVPTEHVMCKHPSRAVLDGEHGGARCDDCGAHLPEWYCPSRKNTTGLCVYTRDIDHCDYCGQPEERK